MTVKVVPIQSKMQKPTLAEVVSRLENLFNNYALRGEDKLSVVLTSLSYCVWNAGLTIILFFSFLSQERRKYR